MARGGAGHWLPLVAVALLWLGAPSPTGAWSRRPPEPPAPPDPGEVVTSRFEDVELVGEDADGTVWKLRAAAGWGREGEGTGTLRGVRATLRRGGHDVLLESERAVVEEGSVFRFTGGVRISWGEYEVRVERAAYLHGRGLVTSDSPAQLTGPGLRLNGVGAEVEVGRRVVRILAEVRAVLGEERK